MHEPLSIRTYALIFGALLVFTALTTWVAFLDLGVLNTVTALTIAVIKMLLVALFFMHLKYSARLNWLFAGAAVFWLLILLLLTASDYLSRPWLEQPPRSLPGLFL